MIRTLCGKCNQNTYYEFSELKGCTNWDCEELDINCATEIKSEIKSALHDKLGFCGCGNPEAAFKFINQYLDLKVKRVESYETDDSYRPWHEYTDSINKLISDNPETIMWIVEYLLNSKEITQHGGNVSGSWLEDIDFKELLEIHLENINV